jgi:hypothetical protein
MNASGVKSWQSSCKDPLELFAFPINVVPGNSVELALGMKCALGASNRSISLMEKDSRRYDGPSTRIRKDP